MVDFTLKDKLETIELARKALATIEESEKLNFNEVPGGIKKIKGFTKKDMLAKAEKDSVFFEHLYEKFINNPDTRIKNAYDNLIAEALYITGQILKEADVAPRTVSPVVDNQVLSEEEMLNYYKRSFNLILEEKFNKPNLRSELLFEDAGDATGGCTVKRVLAPGIKGIMIKCVKNSILDNNDPEAVAKYISAESAIKDAISNVLIPQRIMQQIQDYQNNLPTGYTAIFGNSLQDKINLFNNIVAKIAAIIAPFIFNDALQTSGIKVNFDPVSVAGLGVLDNDTDDDDNLNDDSCNLNDDNDDNDDFDSDLDDSNI